MPLQRLIALLLLLRCAAVPLLHIVTSHNDVLTLLEESAGVQPFALRTYLDLTAALSAARAGDALLVLGDGTLGPASAVNVTQAHWRALLSLNLSGFYIELSSTLPQDAATYAPSKAYYFDRVTARTAALTPQGVQPLDILMAQGAFFQSYPVSNVNSSALVYARVAGSSTAVYGLPPPALLNPVLFAPFPGAPGGLLGSIALSCIVSCRYTPLPKWRGVWNYILGSVLGMPTYNSFPTWTPLVAPFGANPAPALAAAWPPSPLSAFPAALFHAVAPNATAAAIRATDFLYSGSGLLLWGDEVLCPTPFAPPSASYACMLEGFGSELSPSGDQPLANDARMDCSAESAMALALRAGVEAAPASSSSGSAGQPPHRSPSGAAQGFALAAAALLNFTWLYSAAAQGHNDPAKPDYGIVAWGVSGEAWSVCSYGDDNARVILGSMVASAALGALPPPLPPPTTAWDEMIGKSILGNLRLASAHGFRAGRIDYSEFQAGGWQRFHYSGDTYANVSSPQPHYQAQMWAVFLLAYARTCATGGCFQPLYTAALAGLEGTMAAYEAAFGMGGGGGGAAGGAGTAPLPPCQWSAIQNNTYIGGCAATATGSSPQRRPQRSPPHPRRRLRSSSSSAGNKSLAPACLPNFPTPALAQAACALDPSCAGITSQAGGAAPWELRSSATPQASPSGEASYAITNLPACRPTKPSRWEWTEYASEEQGRLLLPLAWLLRVEAYSAPPGTPPNATHLAWVARIAGDYLSTQDGSGGVHETLGPPGQCDACPPGSNAAYGTGEAPLIARGPGEAITDQLYGNNYALVSLVEAGGGFAAPALRLGAYLASIQVAASGGVVGKLSGAWMRGFDTTLWDFDGSAADWGWGPWSIETGWTTTWTSAGLFALAGNTTLFDVVMAQGGGGFSAALVKQLCPAFFAGTEVQCP